MMARATRKVIADHAARTDRLSERERTHQLGVIERLRQARPTRGPRQVDAELRALRATRRAGRALKS